MTYKQIVQLLTTTASSHRMIKDVRNATPIQWIYENGQPNFPLFMFMLENVQHNKGRERIYQITLWLLDKSGMEGKYDTEVVSDSIETMADIVNKLRLGSNTYTIDDSITFEPIMDKYEDYLSGVTCTFSLTVNSKFDFCDAPFN